MSGMRTFFVFLALCALSVDPEEHAGRPRLPLFRIAHETTVIDGPMTELGTINYIAYLNVTCSEGVTPENNAVVVLCQAFGPGIIDAECRKEFFDQLGMEVPPGEGDYIVDLPTYLSRLSPPVDEESVAEFRKELIQLRSRAWTSDEVPEIATWIELNTTPLAIAEHASNRAQYYEPLFSTAGTLVTHAQLPVVQSLRYVSELFTARATMRLGHGDVDGAIDDIFCCYRLSRLVAKGPTVIGRLMAIAMQAQAFAAMTALLESDQLSAEQLSRLSQEFQSLPPPARFDEAVNEAERFACLSVIQEFAIGRLNTDLDYRELTGMQARLSYVERVFRNLRINWNGVHQIANDWYDELGHCLAADSWREFERRWSFIDDRQSAIRKDYRIAMWYLGWGLWVREITRTGGEFFATGVTPHLGSIVNAEYRLEARNRLLQIGFALAAYRSTHGEYPDRLVELVPQYLEELPLDPFSEEGMVYRREAGGYRIYSLCDNLIDDGGVDISESRVNNDVVLRIQHDQ